MERLYVLYDARCGLCVRLQRWAWRQPAYLELKFIPSGSDMAARLFPGLTKPERAEELIVVSDDGGVYRESHAWIMCLFALKEYREWSLRLATPALLPLARSAFDLISKNRARLSRWLDLASEEEIVQTLRRSAPPLCEVENRGRDQETTSSTSRVVIDDPWVNHSKS